MRLAKRCSPPNFHYAFVLYTINDEPRYAKETINFEEGKLWKKATVEEMEALDKNESWYLIKFIDGRKLLVGSKWVFKKKLKVVGKFEKYKYRLIANDYSQVEWIEFVDMKN